MRLFTSSSHYSVYFVYKNTISLSSQSCKKIKIIKYDDDTAIRNENINDNNEQEYRHTISYASNWCEENHPDINIAKTKEIFDNRKKMNHKEPVVNNNTKATLSISYKYLGVLVKDNLKWNEHVTSQVKRLIIECTLSDV